MRSTRTPTPQRRSSQERATITPADCSAINKDTKLEITVNGSVYTVTNAVLKTITAETTEAQVCTMLGNAVNPDGIKLSTVADLVLDEDEILTVVIKLADASASLYTKEHGANW